MRRSSSINSQYRLWILLCKHTDDGSVAKTLDILSEKMLFSEQSGF